MNYNNNNNVFLITKLNKANNENISKFIKYSESLREIINIKNVNI